MMRTMDDMLRESRMTRWHEWRKTTLELRGKWETRDYDGDTGGQGAPYIL